MALFKKKPKDAAASTPAAPKAAAAPKAPAVAKPKVDVRPDLYTLILGVAALFTLIGFILLLLNDLLYQKEGCDATSGVSWSVSAPADTSLA